MPTLADLPTKRKEPVFVQTTFEKLRECSSTERRSILRRARADYLLRDELSKSKFTSPHFKRSSRTLEAPLRKRCRKVITPVCTTYYVDLLGGNNSNNGQSFANRKIDLGNVSASAGDTIRIMRSEAPRNTGINADWTMQSGTVTLASALTKTITTCDSNWTAATNVTCTTNTDRCQGTNSVQIAIASAFGTGLVAYFALGSSQDFSSYQQISFRIKVTSGSHTANVMQVKLCSDTAGATPVDSISIPYTMPSNSNAWYTMALDKGSALGSAIQSIAIYCDSTDPGTLTFLVDNFEACGASSADSSLTHLDLIGKNDNDGWEWYPIRSIVGTTVILDTPVHLSGAPATPRGYYGTTATAALYRKRPIMVRSGNWSTSTSSAMASLSYSGNNGSSASPINISGGWDATNMSTQPTDGDTIVNCQGTGVPFAGGNKSWINYSRLGAVRFTSFGYGTWSRPGDGCTWTRMHSYGNTGSSSTDAPLAMSSNVTKGSWTDCVFIGTSSDSLSSITPSGSAPCDISFSNIKIFSSSGNGTMTVNATTTGQGVNCSNIQIANCGASVSLSGWNQAVDITLDRNAFTPNLGFHLSGSATYRNIVSTNNSGSGAAFFNGFGRLFGITTSGNTVGGIALSSFVGTVFDATCAEATKITSGSSGGIQSFENPSWNSGRWQRYSTLGNMRLQNSVTPSGVAEAIEYEVNNANARSFANSFPIPDNALTAIPLICSGGDTTTHKFQFMRTNANLTGRWIVFGGRYPGIPTDVVVDLDMTANAWEDRTMTLDTDNDCVVESFIQWFHNGTTTYKGYMAGPYEVSAA